MNLRAIGCNVESAAVELREKLAFDAAKLTVCEPACVKLGVHENVPLR